MSLTVVETPSAFLSAKKRFGRQTLDRRSTCKIILLVLLKVLIFLKVKVLINIYKVSRNKLGSVEGLTIANLGCSMGYILAAEISCLFLGHPVHA